MESCFRIDGIDHALWLSRSPGGYRLNTEAIPGGVEISVQVASPPVGLNEGQCSRHGKPPTRLLLTVGGAAIPVVVAQSADELFVHLDGRAYALSYLDPVRSLGAGIEGASEDAILAPMPGMVLAVYVKPGDAVAKGDTLVVIESMKVQTNLRAGRAGSVAAVHAVNGQVFDRDSVLVTLVTGAQT